jgi:hypothetical protein
LQDSRCQLDDVGAGGEFLLLAHRLRHDPTVPLS